MCPVPGSVIVVRKPLPPPAPGAPLHPTAARAAGAGVICVAARQQPQPPPHTAAPRVGSARGVVRPQPFPLQPAQVLPPDPQLHLICDQQEMSQTPRAAPVVVAQPAPRVAPPVVVAAPQPAPAPQPTPAIQQEQQQPVVKTSPVIQQQEEPKQQQQPQLPEDNGVEQLEDSEGFFDWIDAAVAQSEVQNSPGATQPPPPPPLLPTLPPPTPTPQQEQQPQKQDETTQPPMESPDSPPLDAIDSAVCAAFESSTPTQPPPGVVPATTATPNNNANDDVVVISAEEDAALDALLGFDGNAMEQQQPPQQQFQTQPQQIQQQQQQQQQPSPLSLNRPSVIDLSLADATHFLVRLPSTRTELARSYLDSFGPGVDAETGLPVLPLADYVSFVSGLAAVTTLKVSPIPEGVLALFLPSGDAARAAAHAAAEAAVEARLPKGLRDALLPYQREGVVFALERGGRCMIADEMGLGKTVQALGVAACYRDAWPFLVVAPSSLRYQWAESIVRWLGVAARDVGVATSGRSGACLCAGAATVLSYELVPHFGAQLAARRFGLVIADESHVLKNRTTRRTQALRPLLKRCPHALLLSGTPALSRPSEMYSQVEMLDGRLFPRFHDYGLRYCDGHQTQWHWSYDGASNLRELHLVLRRAVMIRRLKADVLGELPTKTRERVSVGIVKQHAETIQRVIADLRATSASLRAFSSGSGNGNHGGNGNNTTTTGAAQQQLLPQAQPQPPAEVKKARGRAKGLLLELYRDSGTAKLPVVVSYVHDLLQGDVKFIVFAHHQDVLDGIAHSLRQADADFVRIDGSTAAQQRQQLVHHFQEQRECRVALLSITAAGVGLTLTAASLVVFAELSWNPGALKQAEDRVHRIGQTADVTIKYLVARNTVDEMMWRMLNTKLDVLGRTLDGRRDESLGSAVETTAPVDPAADDIDPFLQRILEVVDTYGQRRTAADAADAARDAAAAGGGAATEEPIYTFEFPEDEVALAATAGAETEPAEAEGRERGRRGRSPGKGRKTRRASGGGKRSPANGGGSGSGGTGSGKADVPREIVVNLDDAGAEGACAPPAAKQARAGSGAGDDLTRLNMFLC